MRSAKPIGDNKVAIDRAVMVGRVILIEKIWISQILHVPKLHSFAHSFQNCFCFRSWTVPSHVGTFFCTQVDLVILRGETAR